MDDIVDPGCASGAQSSTNREAECLARAPSHFQGAHHGAPVPQSFEGVGELVPHERNRERIQEQIVNVTVP